MFHLLLKGHLHVTCLSLSEELSSYLANSVSEMKQLMDATDYDQDAY